MKNRYIVGIDLGTTNCAVGYVDLHDAAPGAIRIQTFRIPQLVSQGFVVDRSILPSFLYLAAEHELITGAFSLPWDRDRRYAVGVLARDHGADVPGRLVSSAKSWLCHGAVDREAPILPWEAGDDVAKVSPVTASARYLQHMKEAWDHVMPAPIAEQKVVLTVPASFDEVARELTVQAAREAGLPEVVLIEEPLAAFYAWISGHEGDWQGHLRPGDVILVCDVGGGTTDFSLIAFDEADGYPRLERIAVGDHLLLGGDNMDHALAAILERSIGKELDARRWRFLVHQCRKAKEDLLGEDAPAEAVVRIAGLGRSVVGSALLVGRISRNEALLAILEGFFPGAEAASDSPGPSPVQLESGLPYEQDTAITRHLFRFISRQGTGRMPSVILFNGGALTPRVIRDRILETVSRWSGRRVLELESASLDLAVSLGAVYSGLVREGLGLRVGGGLARSYYIGVGTEGGTKGAAKALCLVERGTEEGEDVEIVEPFYVRANRPVQFSLYSSTTRTGDRAGDVVFVDENFVALPPVQTVLRYGKKDQDRSIPVRVGAQVTPIGTLELYCESLESPHRWRLQFQLRKAPKEALAPASGVEGVRVAPAASRNKEIEGEGLSERDRLALEEARGIVRMCFGRAEGAKSIPPAEIIGRLASAMGMEKELWSVPVLRALADVCLEVKPGRAVSREHEERWFNLAGLCLRPGAGETMDPWRIKKVWPLFFEGLFFPREVSVRLQWWIFWRRVAAGLGSGQQAQFYATVAPVLVPAAVSRGRKGAKKAKPIRVPPEERRQMFLFAAGLERLDVSSKIDLGRAIIAEAARDPTTWPGWIWSISRIAAREPLYGPVNKTVPPDEVGKWIKALMGMRLPSGRKTAEACLAMARLTGDRTRDLAPAIRNDLFRWLSNRGSRISELTPLVEVVPLERAERETAFGETLPEGLILAREETA